MLSTFDEAFAEVQALAKDFEANKSHFLSSSYQESEVRKDFIDKFLIALGWDVNHDWQKNPFEQEVKVERGVNMQGSQRRADYSFSIAPNFRDVRFYAEAKKPFGDIASQQNYFQTIRYGWNAQTPIAVLTDFEQFQILDCRYKPDIDTALSHCIRKFHYLEYADKDKFAFIYHLFSRDSVANGSLDKFADTLPKKRGKAIQRGLFKGGYQSIDDAFLEELDEHRETLARSFKNKNPKLDGDTLTEITQRTIDRLVFIRFLEDKLIHPESLVSNFGDKGTVWQDFIAASRRLDGIYNGIVFKRNEILDEQVKMDDDAFGDICERLAHVNSPYDFNSIPIHILGSIYERFLGKVIVTTDKRARVEEKPEVREAHGVYYTPQYIVSYIVENTVGKLIKDKAPNQIAEMRFADIACGSGSFLLGVYDLLLTYHRDWFNANSDKAKKAGCVMREDGAWHLSLKQKREILTRNIYGVDIDTQAVEVAQLSLYLKLLEEETTASARQYFLDFEQQALLPSLSKNIVCGNSLIGTDVGSGELFEPVEEKKLNPMDFEQRFPAIMNDGGFDAIVGNPPYIRIQTMQESAPLSVEYLKSHYEAASKGNYDIYVVFVERGLQLLNSSGRLAYILPNKFFNAQYGQPLRKSLGEGEHLSHIVHFGSEQVFVGATTYTCLLFLAKKPRPEFRFVKVASLADWRTKNEAVEGQIPSARVTGDEWNFNVGSGSSLFDRLQGLPLTLGDVADIYVGLQTSADDVFIMDLVEDNQNALRLKSKSLGREIILERDLVFPLVSGTDVSGYAPLPERQFILFPYTVENEEAKLIPVKEISKNYPKTAEYLHANKKRLEERERGKFKDADWHRFGRSQNLGIQERQKICVPRLVDQLCAAYDESGIHFLDNVDVGGVTLKPDYKKQGLPYLLALLNSRLLRWYFPFVSAPFRGGWMSANRQFLTQLPFRPIDFKKTREVESHANVLKFVEQILAAKKQQAKAQSDKDKDFYENKCAAIEQKIDELVYELYGLTAAEIKIVESIA